ncbi:N-acetylmuramoyl-L-alanine amidase [Acuticoccus sp. MNP-M23]|uniref:N-acetylmuramoyl-L-alanine amidase n=1 Tax=Acuticoccus sp. MNP-M23 TaxID=3072793 RepID=UPI0028149761|nr:N-acetylmuramoyl-L-alanine amidase [Acuticoccus sp. MNP-M23]WMS41294.1 N-acetylmuramoyl-L-alanine amidase [Acuticoccus sp. MNP-M23]
MPVFVPSPNFDVRSGPPDMVVLHYTDMEDAAGAQAWLCNPESRVSAHYLIGADGKVTQMVREEDRAWHAGVSHWDGSSDVNSRSIGIELDSPGHRPGPPSFPAAQMAALLTLLEAICSRWSIAPRNVVAHSDVAPLRKIDPGEGFPWSQLIEAGLALGVKAVPPADDVTAPSLFAALNRCGYKMPDDDAEAAALVRAFHRRMRPDAVDAQADGLTLALARAFADAVAADRAADPHR